MKLAELFGHRLTLLIVAIALLGYLFALAFYQGRMPALENLSERNRLAHAGKQFLVNKLYLDYLYENIIGTETRKRLAGEGAESINTTPELFAKHIAAEIVKWGKVTKDANIKAE